MSEPGLKQMKQMQQRSLTMIEVESAQSFNLLNRGSDDRSGVCLILKSAQSWFRQFSLLNRGSDNPHCLIAVSYTHLTLPTICSVQISVVAGSFKKNTRYTWSFCALLHYPT
eukprot:TRINITY_DN25067_c0_g1_i1.p1 TRINITY_DN25067_c0_g1~~TRINITY_DN25067_c0_g1_i1.p1  ORF type:complete len:112 (-),score=1.15 TRINITY_DN25067_c0_g1_i1:34-369(-)